MIRLMINKYYRGSDTFLIIFYNALYLLLKTNLQVVVLLYMFRVISEIIIFRTS